MVDGIKHTTYPYVEVCAEGGIPVDYIWHAPVAPQNLKFDALGSDPRAPVQIDRILSWGPVNEAWLKRTGARVGELLTVGNRFPQILQSESVLPEPRSRIRTQIGTCRPADNGLYGSKRRLSRQFYQFIHATRELKRQGYKRLPSSFTPA